MRWVHLRINTRVRVLGRLGCTGCSLVELSSTLGVRLKNRRSLFTVKNWAADIKPCKVMSAGCTTWNIYNRHTQYLQLKNVEDAHCSSNTLVVKSRRLKILGYASIHLWWSLESGPADYNWVRETQRRSPLPPLPRLTRAAGKC